MSSITLPVSCNRDCGAGCPLTAHLDDGRITRITDSPRKLPYMQGCARGYQAHRTVYSPERLTTPLIRTGPRGSGEFRRAEWDEALEMAADRLTGIRDRSGAPSVMRIGGSGSCRGVIHNTSILTNRFFALFGGYTTFSDSYSSSAEGFVNPYIFGTRQVGMDAENLLRSRMVILWGANISDTRFGSELENVIREVRKRGVPVISIDPRRSRTAKLLADEWLPILPGSDTAMMTAVLHVLIDEDLVDHEFIRRCSAGFDELRKYVLGHEDGVPKDPQWAAPLCGIRAGRIAEFAGRYGRGKPAALIPGLSIQRTVGGEEAIRMGAALQAVTGNTGKAGGSSGSCIWGRLPGPRMPSFASIPATGPMEPDIRAIAVYRWSDMVLEGTAKGFPADISCLYVVGGNYLATGSDVAKNIRAFEKVDFSICHDLFMTPTAKYCDVVLPATSFLEREDVVFPADNSLFYSAKACDPVGGSRNDFAIFAGLAEKLGFENAFTGGRTAEQWLDHLIGESEIPDAARFKRDGVYIRPERNRNAFAAFVDDPEAHPLGTPSGRIELSSRAYAETGYCPYPVARGFRPDAKHPLFLVSPHARYRINSQNSNDPWFAHREPPGLTMNPADASARGIGHGAAVRVYNERGEVKVPAVVSDDIMPGVVCLLAGAWPGLGGDGGDSAGCANLLTRTEPTLPSGGSRTHATGVEVEISG